MSTIKSRVGRAGRSLAGLSTGRKLAAGGLLAVIVVTGAWLHRQSQRSALEPVLDQPFADADVVQISDHLRARGVQHEIRAGRVLVAADRRLDVLSDLIYADVLTGTGSTESGFDAMIKQTSVWNTPSTNEKMFNRAREITLSRVIGRFRGVRKATVIIDPTHERRINGSVTPSALVDIQTRPAGGGSGDAEVDPQQLAQAAVNAMTGAVSAMSREKVMVTIDGASYNAPPTAATATNDDGHAVGDVLERRQLCEQTYAAKVRQLLAYIPDVLVSVSVDVDVQPAEQEKRIVGSEQQAQAKAQAESRSDPVEPIEQESSVLANAVPQPVEVEPLQAAAAAAAELMRPARPAPRVEAAAPNSVASQAVSKARTTAGKETVVSASVAVPRSWFVALYKRSSTKTQEPDDALLQPIVDARLGRIRNLVRTSLGLQDESDVTVEVYEDVLSSQPMAAEATTVGDGADVASVLPAPAATLSVIASLAKVKWQWWGYAGLAVMTLLMVSMMLRRGSGGNGAGVMVGAEGATFAASPAQRRRQIVIPPRGRAAKVTSATSPHAMTSDGDEEEDDLLRQVRELASRQPDDAARVLREWIYQG